MHEMGIANSVLDAVRAETVKVPGSRASRVGLRIGDWSGVDVESLRFCLEGLTIESDLSGLSVDIDQRPRKNRCSRCQTEFVIEGYRVQCPRCQCDDTTAIGGEELDIAYVELED
jgi:hydrogenase nickel incorporation protein HypA/HybF